MNKRKNDFFYQFPVRLSGRETTYFEVGFSPRKSAEGNSVINGLKPHTNRTSY